MPPYGLRRCVCPTLSPLHRLADVMDSTAAACIVRTALSWQVTSDDLTWVGVGNALARIFEINLGMIAACIPLMRPLIRFLRIYFFGPPSSSRLSSDENLSRHTQWFNRWRKGRLHQSSHGANEPETFEEYVKYTRDWRRRRRPPGHGAVTDAVRADSDMMDTVARAKHEPVLSSVPSATSLHLPLHGVPKPEITEKGENTLRYSTADPIQDLKGILETGRLSRNLEEEIRRSESMDESARLSRYSSHPRQPRRHIVSEMRRSRSSGKWDEEMGRPPAAPRHSSRYMDDETKEASRQWAQEMERSRRSSRNMDEARRMVSQQRHVSDHQEEARTSRKASRSATRADTRRSSRWEEEATERLGARGRAGEEMVQKRPPYMLYSDADMGRRRSWRHNEDEIGTAY